MLEKTESMLKQRLDRKQTAKEESLRLLRTMRKQVDYEQVAI